MRNKSDIHDFINVFVYDELPGVAKKYAEFRKSAILSADNYKNLCEELKTISFEWEIDPEKKWIFGVFEAFVNVFSKGSMEDKKHRQLLIDTISEKMDYAYQTQTEMNKYLYNVGVRFLTLHIIIDTIFAFSSFGKKIQLSAMFYDMMHRMTEQGDADFNKFYGEEAENEILESTFNNLLISCYAEETSPSNVILTASSDTDAPYVKSFCTQLENMCQTHPMIELDDKNKRKKRKIVPKNKTEEATDKTSAETTDSDTEKTEEQEEKKKAAVPFRLPEGMLLPSIFIGGVLIALILGFFLGNAFGPSGRKLSERELQITELETEAKALNSELTSLKNEVKKYEEAQKETAEGAETEEGTGEETEEEIYGGETEQSEETEEETTSEEAAEPEEVIDGERYVLDTYRMIRAGRNASTEALATGAEGETIIILEPQDEAGWARIRYGEIEGYMYLPY